MKKFLLFWLFGMSLLFSSQAHAQWLVHDAAQDQGNILQTLRNNLQQAYEAVTKYDLEAQLAKMQEKYVKQCEAVQWAIKQYDTLNETYNTLEKTYSFINRQIGTVEGIYTFFNSDFSDPSTIRNLITSQASSLRDTSVTYDSVVTQAADKVLGSDLYEPQAKAESELVKRAKGALAVSDEADKAAQAIAEKASQGDKGVENAVKGGSANVLNLLHALYKSGSYSGQMLVRLGVSFSALLRLRASKDQKEAEEKVKKTVQEAQKVVEESEITSKTDAAFQKAIKEQQGNKYIDDFWDASKMKAL